MKTAALLRSMAYPAWLPDDAGWESLERRGQHPGPQWRVLLLGFQ